MGLSNGPWGIVRSQRNSRGDIKLSCSESPENWQEEAGGSRVARPLYRSLPQPVHIYPSVLPRGKPGARSCYPDLGSSFTLYSKHIIGWLYFPLSVPRRMFKQELPGGESKRPVHGPVVHKLFRDPKAPHHCHLSCVPIPQTAARSSSRTCGVTGSLYCWGN